MKGLPEIQLAARADALGIDGAAALDGDPVLSAVLEARADLALQARHALNDDLANRIIARLAEAF